MRRERKERLLKQTQVDNDIETDIGTGLPVHLVVSVSLCESFPKAKRLKFKYGQNREKFSFISEQCLECIFFFNEYLLFSG